MSLSDPEAREKLRVLAPPFTVSSLSFFSRLSRLVGGREFWALVDQAMVSGTNFLTNVVLARLAGIEAFGAFALAWMVVLFANLFQSALIVSPMMSLRPKIDNAKRSEYLGALLVHEAIFASTAAVIVQVVCHFVALRMHKPALGLIGPGLAAATFCYLVQDFLRRYLFTIRRSSAAFWTDLLSYPPQIIIIAFVAKLHGISTGGALWVVAVTSGAGILVALFFLEPATFSRTAAREIAIRHWGMSRWLALSVVLDWSSNNLFFVAAPVFFGAAAAGVVRATQNLVGIAHIWFIGLGNVIPAEMARALHSGGISDARRYMRLITLRWGGLTAIFCTCVFLAPKLLLHLVYGAQFEQYGSLLRLYAILYILVFLGFPIRAMLQTLERTASIFWAYVVMTSFAAIFAIPFVRSFGLNGVVLGNIVTELIFLTVVYITMRKRMAEYTVATSVPSSLDT